MSQCSDCLSYFVINGKCYGYCEEWDSYVLEDKIKFIGEAIEYLKKNRWK